MANFKLRFLLFILLLSSTIFAQDRDIGISQKNVPTSIISYLQKNYGQNLKVKYYEEKSDTLSTIQTDFIFENRNYILSFTNQGKFLKEQVELQFNGLPNLVQTNIKEYLSEKYPNYKILKSQEVNPNTERSVYKVVVRHSGNYYHLYFDKKGNFTKYDELIFQPIYTQF